MSEMSKSISGVEYIRVKRRRDEDSVQALLLEGERNAKKGKFVFKLSKTVELETPDVNSPLLKLSNENNDKKMVYVLERERERQEVSEVQEELPDSIAEMLNEYLKIKEKDSPEHKKRKASRKHSKSYTAPILPPTEYVYDVYVKQTIPEDEDEFVFDKSTIGYIRIVEHNGDMIPEEEVDPEKTMLTDDEDSNEEDYYQNDYPEDEDDDRSIFIGSDEDRTDSEDIVYLDDINDELDQDYNVGDEQANETTNDNSDEFDALFQNYGESSNLLSSLNANNYVDLDYDDDDHADSDDNSTHNGDFVNLKPGADDDHDTGMEVDDQTFKRNYFFPTDKDDEDAIHRDRIFGRLQKMIDKV
ncbi:Iwr1 [Kluyveromyces lactis]|nr:Iwr1 [Kluyveromyces lactis]